MERPYLRDTCTIVQSTVRGGVAGVSPAEGVAAYFLVGTFHGTFLQENSCVGGDIPQRSVDWRIRT